MAIGFNYGFGECVAECENKRAKISLAASRGLKPSLSMSPFLNQGRESTHETGSRIAANSNERSFQMEFPQSVIKITQRCAAKFPDDIDAAVDLADKQVRNLPDFKSFEAELVREAIRARVHDERHITNRQIKNDTGAYSNQSKIDLAGAVNDAYASVYLYSIAGKSLGSVMGNELEKIAADEKELMEGHRFNVMLTTWLATLVPEDKTVRESVPEDKLRRGFERLQKKSVG
jgi:hypothetical protein